MASGVVVTLFRGSPLVAPGSLCCADDDCLLICDSGSCCIWSFHLDTRELLPKISAESMYLLNVELFAEIPKRGTGEQHGSQIAASRSRGKASPTKLQEHEKGCVIPRESVVRIIPSNFVGSGGSCTRFNPVCIARVTKGWYVFGETNSRHNLYRYLESSVVAEEVDRLRTIATEVVMPFRNTLRNARLFSCLPPTSQESGRRRKISRSVLLTLQRLLLSASAFHFDWLRTVGPCFSVEN
jgi:hypothetical protein